MRSNYNQFFCYTLFSVLNYSSYQTNNTKSSAPFQNKFKSVVHPLSKFTNKASTDFIQTEKVVIGLVSCRKGQVKGNFYYDQIFTLIKSLLISCKLYNIPALEIYLLLEYVKDEEHFRNEINQTSYFPEDLPQIQLTLKVHAAVDTVPKKYQYHVVYHPRFRCCYVQLFFPINF